MDNELSSGFENRLNLLDDRLNSIFRMLSSMMDKKSGKDSIEEKMDENNSLLQALCDRSDRPTYMPYAG